MAKVQIKFVNGDEMTFVPEGAEFDNVYDPDNETGLSQSGNTQRRNKFIKSVHDGISGTEWISGGEGGGLVPVPAARALWGFNDCGELIAVNLGDVKWVRLFDDPRPPKQEHQEDHNPGF